MVYCAGKLVGNLKLFYKRNRPHFLWVYRAITLLGSARDLQAFLVLIRVLPASRVQGCHTGKEGGNGITVN